MNVKLIIVRYVEILKLAVIILKFILLYPENIFKKINDAKAIIIIKILFFILDFKIVKEIKSKQIPITIYSKMSKLINLPPSLLRLYPLKSHYQFI